MVGLFHVNSAAFPFLKLLSEHQKCPNFPKNVRGFDPCAPTPGLRPHQGCALTRAAPPPGLRPHQGCAPTRAAPPSLLRPHHCCAPIRAAPPDPTAGGFSSSPHQGLCPWTPCPTQSTKQNYALAVIPNCHRHTFHTSSKGLSCCIKCYRSITSGNTFPAGLV